MGGGSAFQFKIITTIVRDGMGGGDEFIKGVPMGLVCAINNIPVHWVGQPDRSATD